MIRSRLVMLAVCCSTVALGAEPAPAAKDRAPELNEIERGVYLSVAAGFWSIINPPADPGTKQPFAPGVSARVELGYDIGERIGIGLFVIAANNRAGSDYTGRSFDPALSTDMNKIYRASGDFSELIPGANLRLELVGFNDAQEVKRFWVYVRAGAGFVVYQPSALIPGSDVLIFAGPGFEYFTRLRHFAVGLEATLSFLALTQSVGFAITPTVRYDF